VLLAIALHRYVGHRLGAREPIAWLLLISVGVILSATLTPGTEPYLLTSARATCDLSRLGLAPITTYLTLGTTSLNVILFVPLGISIALLPRSPAIAFAVFGAALLPLAIESSQLVATPLGRACQGADVIDNMLGLALGLAAGWTGAWISRRLSKQPHRGTSPSG
jgi:glycopeptide antibiotics resistance protein